MIGPSWDIPLGFPPEVMAIGRNAHGDEAVDRYFLPDLWALHLYGYEADLRIGDLDLTIRPGYAGITPPGKAVEYRYRGVSVHLYVHFRLPTDLAESKKISAMQDLGERYEVCYRRLYEVIGSFEEDRARVNARVWDLLWELSGGGSLEDSRKATHPAVRKAVDLVARNLDSPIVIEELAAEVGVSYSYLARLFQKSFGTTVIQYLHGRRMDRAIHLLERSTLPIKTIAANVGFSDLQHFNKVVRAHFGLGPRAIRERYLGR